jgi:putative ABC transport system permease protein
LLTESVLVAVAGGAAGVLLALAGVPAVLALAPEGKIPRADEIGPDARVLAFTFGLSVLTGLLFGLAPAVRATRRELRRWLAEGGRTVTGRGAKLRNALVVSEVALALILLTGAGLLLKSFWRMHAIHPGFRPENVLAATVDLPETRYRSPEQMRAFHQRILDGLRELPGIDSAGAVNWMPLGRNLIRGDFHLEAPRERPPGYIVDKLVVSPNYFRAMGIRLLMGRPFSERDHAAAPGVVVVSGSVARALWPGEDPIGKRMTMSDRPKAADWLTVVGVVDDVRQQQLTAGPSPAIYHPYQQTNSPFFLSHMTFVVRSAANPGALAPAIRVVIQRADPDQAVQSIETMEDVIAGTTAEPRFRTRLIGAFAVMAVALAAIGIYGVLACSIAERTHEIGVRMAIGASRAGIVGMVVRRTLLLAGTGLALGTAGALAVTRVLENLLFEVRPTDPGTYAAVAVFLAMVAVLAGLMPARRAASVDPLAALRYE